MIVYEIILAGFKFGDFPQKSPIRQIKNLAKVSPLYGNPKPRGNMQMALDTIMIIGKSFVF